LIIGRTLLLVFNILFNCQEAARVPSSASPSPIIQGTISTGESIAYPYATPKE